MFSCSNLQVSKNYICLKARKRFLIIFQRFDCFIPRNGSWLPNITDFVCSFKSACRIADFLIFLEHVSFVPFFTCLTTLIVAFTGSAVT